MAKLDAFLEIMRKEGASDLVSAGLPPVLRIKGALQRAAHRALSADEVRILVYELLTELQIKQFEDRGQLDCAHTIEGVARFRIHLFKKHPGIAAAFRMIPHEVPTLAEMGLPEVLQKMLTHCSGLILVTGPTNSGKSTTLAAMVNHLNEKQNLHILTEVDPVSWTHPNCGNGGVHGCRRGRVVYGTRRSSGGRWSSWSGRGARRKSWRASSSPQRTRSGNGSSSWTRTRDCARMG